MQLRLEEKLVESVKYYGISPFVNSSNDEETDDNIEADLDEEGFDADLGTGNKNTCVLEVTYKLRLNAKHQRNKLNTEIHNFVPSLIKNTHFKIGDSDDANILDSLRDPFPPPNILVYSTEEIIGLSPEHIVKCCQSFTQVKTISHEKHVFAIPMHSFHFLEVNINNS